MQFMILLAMKGMSTLEQAVTRASLLAIPFGTGGVIMGKYIILIAGGALALAFLLAHWFQGLISKPIRHLVEIMGDVTSHKDYSRRIPADLAGKDEIGELVAGFNAMLITIKQRDDDLEKTVQQRTAEL